MILSKLLSIPFGLLKSKSIFALLDQGIVSITNFSSGVIVGRLAGPEELGLYSLGFTLILLLTTLQDTLTTTPYMVYNPRLSPEHKPYYFGSTLVHHLAVSFLSTVLLALASLLLFIFQPDYRIGIVLLSLSMVFFFIVSREYLRKIYFANLNIRLPFFFDAFSSVIQLSTLLILAKTDRLSAVTAYWAIGLAAGAILVFLAGSVRTRCQIKMSRVREDFRHNWGFGRWLLISAALFALTMNVYPWLLAMFHGAASAGVWAACIGLTALGNPILLGMQNVIGPRVCHAFANEDLQSLRREVNSSATIFGAILTPIVVLLVAGGGMLVAWIYGDAYLGNGAIVVVLSCNMLLTAVIFPFSRALFALGRTDLDLRINIIGLIPLVTVGIFLTWKFGALGAACGLLLSNIFSSIVRLAVLREMYRRLSWSKALSPATTE